MKNQTPVQNPSTPRVTNNAVRTHFQDSFENLYEATTDTWDQERSRRLSRAALLSTVMYIEAVANACLAKVNLSDKALEQFDKLPAIQKLELYGGYAHGTKIDYGRVETQRIHEVIKVRNAFVHPKEADIVFVWDEEQAFAFGSSKKTNSLGLPLISENFRAADAIKSIQAAHSFLSHFFLSQCALTHQEVGKILFSIYPESPEIVHKPTLRPLLRKLIAKNNISLDYLKFSDFPPILNFSSSGYGATSLTLNRQDGKK